MEGALTKSHLPLPLTDNCHFHRGSNWPQGTWHFSGGPSWNPAVLPSQPSSHCLPSCRGPSLLPPAALLPCSASSSLICLLPPPLHFPFAGNNSQELYTRLLQPRSLGAQGNVSSDWLGGGCQEPPRPHFQLLESSVGTAGCWKPPDTYCAPALLNDQ